MLSFTITVNPGDTITTLERFVARLNQLDEFLLDLGQVVSDEMAVTFSTAPWPPLAAATIAQKQAEGMPLAVLIRSQEMYGAAVGGLWQATGGGTDAEAVLEVPGYSGFHFEGTSFMPARDYAMLPNDFGAQTLDAFMGFLLA